MVVLYISPFVNNPMKRPNQQLIDPANKYCLPKPESYCSVLQSSVFVLKHTNKKATLLHCVTCSLIIKKKHGN